MMVADGLTAVKPHRGGSRTREDLSNHIYAPPTHQLEDVTMKNELPNSIKLDSRTKKREKISNMMSSIAGEKKEIMRYDFPNKS